MGSDNKFRSPLSWFGYEEIEEKPKQQSAKELVANLRSLIKRPSKKERNSEGKG